MNLFRLFIDWRRQETPHILTTGACLPVRRHGFGRSNIPILLLSFASLLSTAAWAQSFEPPYQLAGPAVAVNAQDKWIATYDDQLFVITSDGKVFVHLLDERIQNAYQLAGPRVAANPQDRRVFVSASQSAGGLRIIVVTSDGRVFAHNLTGGLDKLGPQKTIGDPYELSGAKVGANPQDKWALSVGDRILVGTNDGRVFVHVLDAKTVSNAYQLVQSHQEGLIPPVVIPIAANPQDRWVFNFNGAIGVITKDGRLFVHRMDLTTMLVQPAFQYLGGPFAANPQDKLVFYLPDPNEYSARLGAFRVAVLTSDGKVFVHRWPGCEGCD